MSDLSISLEQATINLSLEPLKKLHTCPLNGWCDKCAYCEFGYDDLIRKFQQATEEKECHDLNAILEEKISSCTSKLYSMLYITNSILLFFINFNFII